MRTPGLEVMEIGEEDPIPRQPSPEQGTSGARQAATPLQTLSYTWLEASPPAATAFRVMRQEPLT